MTVNTLHPGFVRTNFFQDWGGWIGFITKLGASVLALTPEQGARTSIYLASSPEVEAATGQYFVQGEARAVLDTIARPGHGGTIVAGQ